MWWVKASWRWRSFDADCLLFPGFLLFLGFNVAHKFIFFERAWCRSCVALSLFVDKRTVVS